MLVPDTTDERDEGHCVAGYSVVRPGRVEHVGYCPLRLCWLQCLKHERKIAYSYQSMRFRKKKKKQQILFLFQRKKELS